MRPLDILLFALVVYGWSTSWLPLKWQAVPGVAPEVSVMWRFILAGGLMMVFAVLTGRWRIDRSGLLMAIGLGVCLFSCNFMLFYYGAYQVTSGLLAVMFATASLINLFYSRLLFGTTIGLVALGGTVLGFSGVALLYWPEISQGQAGLVSLAFCLSGTLLFCTGNMISTHAQRQGYGIVPLTAWGMICGALAMLGLSLIRGKPLTWEPTWTYVGGTVYLAIFSSIIAFGAYLNLLGRIGPGRAAYATVLFPPFALLISTVVEGYEWTWLGAIGLLCVLLGLVMVMLRR